MLEKSSDSSKGFLYPHLSSLDCQIDYWLSARASVREGQKRQGASEIFRFVYNRRGYQKQSTCLRCFEELCSQYDIRAGGR